MGKEVVGLIDKEALSLTDRDWVVERLCEKDMLTVWLIETELDEEVTIGDVDKLVEKDVLTDWLSDNVVNEEEINAEDEEALPE